MLQATSYRNSCYISKWQLLSSKRVQFPLLLALLLSILRFPPVFLSSPYFFLRKERKRTEDITLTFASSYWGKPHISDKHSKQGLREYETRILTIQPNFLNFKINPLKPGDYCTYCQVWHTKIWHSAHSVFICCACVEEKQQILPYTAFNFWVLYPRWQVFTARYAMGL